MSLRLENVGFSYKNRPILREVSFEVQPGEFAAVVGANAVGKSTLLKTISGILRGGGQISLNGAPMYGLSARQLMRRVGYLTQESGCHPVLTVFDTVLLGRMPAGALKVNPEELHKVWRTLKALKIEHLAERLVGRLSGGQRRLAMMAQVLVRDPEVLLLDEPIANLDLQNQLEVLELLLAYTRARRSVTIVTLHELNLAARFADRILIMLDGRIYKDGPPAEVLTADSIRHCYGIEAEVGRDRAGVPQVHPLRTIRSGAGFDF